MPCLTLEVELTGCGAVRHPQPERERLLRGGGEVPEEYPALSDLLDGQALEISTIQKI